MSGEGDGGSIEAELEGQLDSFVQLESDLTERAAVTAEDVSGPVVKAEQVDPSTVPDGYPLSITTSTALKLDVQVTQNTMVPVYLEWPEQFSSDAHLAQLLDALGLEPDQFAEIYGETVALEYHDGFHVLDLSGTRKGEFGKGIEEPTPSPDQTVRTPIPGTEAKAFGNRALAFSIDLLILTGLVAAAATGLFFVEVLIFGEDILGGLAVALRGFQWVLFTGMIAAYFLVLDGRFDGTIGKRIAGVTVATADGEPAGYKEVAIRTATLLLPIPLVAASHMFLWIFGPSLSLPAWVVWLGFETLVAILDDDRRRIGDYLAGTVVVEAE